MPSQTPADFFHLIFTNELLDVLVTETNRYQISKIHTHLFIHVHLIYSYAELRISTLEREGQMGRRSRFHKWKPLTRAQMWGFLALLLNMGIIQLPDIEDYWKTSWVCQIPFFSTVLPRDRFQEIFWMMHIGTAGSTPRKIDKIKPLLDILLPRFYKPSKNLSIDETMVGFRGQNNICHKNPPSGVSRRLH